MKRNKFMSSKKKSILAIRKVPAIFSRKARNSKSHTLTTFYVASGRGLREMSKSLDLRPFKIGTTSIRLAMAAPSNGNARR
jgi:hypothetical protein